MPSALLELTRRYRRLAPSPPALPLLPLALLAVVTLFGAAGPAEAFCGFYVGKADTKLFNQASQVVLVRDGDRTVVTMSNDYQGALDAFAMVIPVPTLLERGQIHIGDRAVIEHLDAYTAPRLVEYFDSDPCMAVPDQLYFTESESDDKTASASRREESLGVRIEATYSVGEYDILILSAEQSDGLAIWLRENGYVLPAGAERILGSYIKQDMRFFVAKVDLAEQERLGYGYLRPLQLAYESPRFALPIRLGTLNAAEPQELFVYALTRTGRVETTNYRTVKLPSDVEVPGFVKDDFGAFYRALFERQVKRERRRGVFLEYAWDMAWCDPCAADPLSQRELRGLGVFWIPPSREGEDRGRGRRGGRAPNVFVTRLHLRYDAARFPADLMFQETGNRENFQGRYILRHPFEGEVNCTVAGDYYDEVRARQEQEAKTLASLTGWDLAGIREKLDLERWTERVSTPWWQRLWSDDE